MDKLNLVLPAGRFISGSLTEKNKTDHENKPLPEEKWHFFFAVAVRKDAPGVNDIIGQIYNMASIGYQTQPQVAQQIAMGFNGEFAWKIADGDLPNSRGTVNEHSAGCYVFKFGTQYPIRACNDGNIDIDPKQIERGFYVDVAFSSSINGATGRQAGIYLNPNIVRLVGYGDKIVSGPTPDQAFGSAPAQLPQGASATPVASVGMPAGQPQQQPMGMPAGQPQQQPMGMPAGQPQQQPMGMPAGQPQQQPMGMPAGQPQQQPMGMPAGQPQQQPMGNAPTGMPAAAPSQGMPAPTGAPSGQPATQYPSNVQPHTGFPNGPQQ